VRLPKKALVKIQTNNINCIFSIRVVTYQLEFTSDSYSRTISHLVCEL